MRKHRSKSKVVAKVSPEKTAEIVLAIEGIINELDNIVYDAISEHIYELFVQVEDSCGVLLDPDKLQRAIDCRFEPGFVPSDDEL